MGFLNRFFRKKEEELPDYTEYHYDFELPNYR